MLAFKKIRFGIWRAQLALTAFLIYTTKALAQTTGQIIPEKNGIFSGDLRDIGSRWGTVKDTINTLFDVLIYAAGAIFIILILIGGIRYLTAAGNEENLGKAKTMLVHSIVGLIIVMASWAIGTWILGMVGFKPS